MVIKWRVQWEIHISLESSYHKEYVKYQTMMWTIMLNSQFRTYWILLSTRLSNIPFFLVQLCVRCSWINLLSSFSSLYLIITRVTYVLVHQLMFWVILFLSFFWFERGSTICKHFSLVLKVYSSFPSNHTQWFQFHYIWKQENSWKFLFSHLSALIIPASSSRAQCVLHSLWRKGLNV